jgi:LacI family repressor for deo operon, udp, cdd, tsx, nupC, and nupG
MKLIRKEMKPADWNVRLPLTLLDRDTTGPVLHKDYKALKRSAV